MRSRHWPSAGLSVGSGAYRSRCLPLGATTGANTLVARARLRCARRRLRHAQRAVEGLRPGAAPRQVPLWSGLHVLVAAAARQVGISRATVYRHLKRGQRR